MQRLSRKAVLIGGMVNAATMVVAFGMLYVINIVAPVLGFQLIFSASATGGRLSLWLLPSMLLFTAVAILWGGFVAGRVARHDEWLNGAVAGALGYIGGQLVMIGMEAVTIDTAFVLAAGLGAFGGFLSSRDRSKAAPAE
ncbi:MAG TPA: hypothetical protein VLX85_09610 [Stellaceae bacterium]|nr:hypothetical protein [Stellaceae bacterium]